jgi:hypothetical protein
LRLGIVILGYSLFRNVYPFPTGIGWWGPGTAFAWLLFGVIWSFARPGAAMRAGAALMRVEGLGGPVQQDAAVR